MESSSRSTADTYRPLSLRKAWKGALGESGRSLAWTWASASAVIVFAAALIPGPTLTVPVGGVQTALTFYWPVLLSAGLVLWIGYTWGAILAFAAGVAWALTSGVSLPWSLAVGAAHPLGLSVLALAYRAAPVSVSARSVSSAVFFILTAFVAALLSSVGAFAWSASEGLSPSGWFVVWQGWWFGTFLVWAVGLTPLLMACTPALYRWREQNELLAETAQVETPLHTATALFLAAVVVIGYGLILQRLELVAVDAAIELLSESERTDVQGAFDTLSLVQWVTFVLLAAVGFVSYQVARGWMRAAAELKANSERLEQANETLQIEIDIRERAEQELAEVLEDLREANRAKAMLLSIISHDLRGPIGTALSLARLVAQDDGHNAEERQELAELLSGATHDAATLLDNLLAWSQARSDSLQPALQPVGLLELVRRRLEFVASRAQQKGVRLRVGIAPDLSVMADPRMIETVVYNLVSNAVKFTNPGGLVQLRALRQSGGVRIEVADTGVGMSEADLNRALGEGERFTRSGTAGEQGTGLGLSLCVELLALHGSRLEAESAPGAGTAFRFNLPAAQSKAARPVAKARA